jgi:hypothetical protein
MDIEDENIKAKFSGVFTSIKVFFVDVLVEFPKKLIQALIVDEESY